jgi:hypothetical protein
MWAGWQDGEPNGLALPASFRRKERHLHVARRQRFHPTLAHPNTTKGIDKARRPL